MNSQILKYNKKKKCKTRLVEWQNLKKNEHISNACFLKDFSHEKIEQEIENISWVATKNLTYSLYSCKNSISIENEIITGGSKFLKSYVSPFSATIVKILKNVGAINLINSNLDEFGMSGTGLDSHYGNVTNPFNNKHMIGGSSSGSAYLVSKNIVDFALGTDTGDSGRIPASNSDIYGYKPSYGLVSRYGIFPFCAQFDSLAIFTKNIEDTALVMSEISCPDPKDLNTLNTEKKNYHKLLNKKLPTKIKIAVFKKIFDNNDSQSKDLFSINKQFKKTIDEMKKHPNIQLTEIDFDDNLLQLSTLIYQIISYSESVSAYSCLNGLIFPFIKNTDDKYVPEYTQNETNYKNILKNSRQRTGKEFKFRQILGRYFLDGNNYENIYLKAKKFISAINTEINKLFQDHDFVISPISSNSAKKIKYYKKQYKPDIFSNILLLANFCGLPAISVPWIFNKNLPIGIHLFGKYKSDEYLMQTVSFLKKNNLI